MVVSHSLISSATPAVLTIFDDWVVQGEMVLPQIQSIYAYLEAAKEEAK